MSPPRRYPALHDPDYLRAQVVTGLRSVASVAAEIGCAVPTLRGALDRHGISLSERRKVCETCGETYPPAAADQRWCSEKCRSVPTAEVERPFPELYDEAWLRDRYETQGRSAIEIAASLGCNPQSVANGLHRYGIKVRGRWSDKWNPKPCQVCGTEFTPTGPASRYCSPACQWGTAECETCGTTFVKRRPQPKSPNDNRFCTTKCRWAAVQSRDDYGRYRDKNGYTVINVRRREASMHRDLHNGYVRVNTGGRRVGEHILVWEEHNGPVPLGGTVHHIDLDKTNNDISNLQLRVGRHGKGAAVGCLDCGSTNVGWVPLADSAAT